MTLAQHHVFSPDIRQRLKSLTSTDNWHSGMYLLWDYAWILFAIALAKSIPLLYPISALIIGSRQRALASIFHDAVHSRAASNSVINYIYGAILSAGPILQTFSAYRHSHILKHHRHLGDPEEDPDLQFYIQLGLYQNDSRGVFFLRQVIAPLLMLKNLQYLHYVALNRLKGLRSHPSDAVLLISFWSIVLALAWYFNLFSTLLLFWFLPLVLVFPVIGRFIEIAEHFPLLDEQQNILNNSRNRFSHPLEAFLFSLHNEHLHLSHHLRPDIPFWNISRAHEIMLEDSHYRIANESFGGIFLSANGQPSVISQMLSDRSSPLLASQRFDKVAL